LGRIAEQNNIGHFETQQTREATWIPCIGREPWFYIQAVNNSRESLSKSMGDEENPSSTVPRKEKIVEELTMLFAAWRWESVIL
jgi:hypothetical protein